MRKRLIPLMITVLILIITIGAAAATDNSTEIAADNATIAPNNDIKTFADIQNQIDDAGENTTIELEGIYQSSGKAIEIKKPITIASKNGATLDAQFKSNIFNISNVNVCLKNLNFINSQSETTSAIFNQGNLTIIDSNFTNNTVFNQDMEGFILGKIDRSAGAIYSTNYLNIQGCNFEENHAETLMQDYEYFDGEYLADFGGSICSKGTAIINKSKFKYDYIESYDNLNIINSEFITSNIICYSNTSVVNSTFTKNPDFSSAIQTTSNLNVTGCNFTNNGGYVINSESYDENMCKIIIDNCNIINNNLKSAGFYDYSSDEEFNEESSTIFGESSDIYVYNSHFENNTANAIDNHWGNLFVQNSTFTKNSGYVGGAIDCYNSTIINSTFKDNEGKFAGAIYSTILVLNDCDFTNNNEGTICAEETAIINGKSYSGLNYFNDSLNKIKLITPSVGKLTTTYQSGKTVWIKLVYTQSKHYFSYKNIDLKITKGKKVYYDDVDTNSKGTGYYKASNLAVGTYKLTFSYGELFKISTTVKIAKAKTIIKAPKVTAKHKKTKYFKITVKNKATKKVVKNTYVKIKIAKKVYKIKTNSKGVAKFNTKKLKIGKHKVVIGSGNSNYIMSGKSTITIKR